MSEKLTKIHLSTWRLFITAHAKLINKIDKELQSAGQIPLNWYDVLIELHEAPEQRLRMSGLAEKVVLSRSGLTRLVDKLEKKGYLSREIDPDDRRGFFAILTTDGESALKSAWIVYRDSIATYFATYFDKDEAEMMQTILSNILEPLE